MYRGSAARVLVERGFYSNPAIPPQKTQKFGYLNLVDFIRPHCTVEGFLLGECFRRVLEDLLRKTAVSGAMSG